MKVRVKATGEIVELNPYDEVYEKQKEPFKSKMHKICHLEGIEIFDEPDYWTRLEHQAAIAAMQGLVTHGEVLGSSVQEIARDIAEISCEIAHALVEKYKKEEK